MRGSLPIGLLVVAGGLSLATSAKNPANDPVVTPSASPAPRRAARRAPPPAVPRPYATCPGKPGTLKRNDLIRILDRKPATFLRGLEVRMVPRAALSDRVWSAWGKAEDPQSTSKPPANRFGGWRIERFHPGDPCLSRAGIQTGDIIVSVNENSLKRPEDLAALWQSLRQARHLIVRLVRQGEPLVFVVQITQ